MRYIGSKAVVANVIAEIVGRRASEARSLCDPFAGTRTIARHFKRLGYRVVTGDVLHLSFAFQTATIGLNRTPRFGSLFSADLIRKPPNSTAQQAVFEHLNAMAGRRGYITEHFSLLGARGDYSSP
jgi:adenine-specific DNA-methyltransferase